MTPLDEVRYIQAYARIIGVKEDAVIEYAQKKGMAALVDNASQLLATPTQKEKHQAFLDLYRMSSAITHESPILNSPEAVADFMRSVMDKIHDKEAFVVAFLNTKNRIIDYDEVSLGSISSAVVHPREVFRNAIVNKASSVVICHNHPSGDLTPSKDDMRSTERLKQAGELVGIPVIDHVIVNGLNRNEYYSFRTEGVLEEQAHYRVTPKMAEKKATYQTKKNDLKEITDRLEEGIRDLFESDKYKNYLRVMSRFHNYSFNNICLIAMQKPDASFVAGYYAWQRKFKRHVCKGEKGIRIIAPAPIKKEVEREKLDPKSKQPIIGADGKPLMETATVTVPQFKVVPVFDISQTEGKELPTLVEQLQGSVKDYDLIFKALKAVSPVPIAFETMDAAKDGYFHLRDKRIALREGMSEIQTVGAAIHEIAHAKLHDIDLDHPENTAPEARKDQRTREIEAESIAYTVCQHYGIETDANSFGYVAGWSSDKELKELKASLETIRITAGELINAIDAKVLELEQQQAALLPEITTRQMAAETLAVKLDSLLDDYDPYGRRDALEADSDPVAETCGFILAGDSKLRSWLEEVAQEGTDAQKESAVRYLQGFDKIQQQDAFYHLQNGEFLTLHSDDQETHFILYDAFLTRQDEGVVSEPQLMLDAAKDLTLSEQGRDQVHAREISAEDFRHIQTLGDEEPIVTFLWSEHEEIADGMKMPLSQANRLMEELDTRQRNDREQPDHEGLWYYKTSFRIDYVHNGEHFVYSGRQDIGDGDGSLVQHIQQHANHYLNDASWQRYLADKSEAEREKANQDLRSMRDEIVPYFNAHCTLSQLEQRTNGYISELEALPVTERTDRINGSLAYYADVQEYVRLSRQQMNLTNEPQMPEFPQMRHYVPEPFEHAKELDLDQDGVPSSIDIDDQDSRLQLAHHFDKRDGLDEKPSIRDRLRAPKGKNCTNRNERNQRMTLEID